ncbi:MAG: YciI-like protein [Thermodesulfobacteriota bacterium]|jgi:uncharacterized protein YciI
MYYILLYDVVENYVERRAPYREEHLKRVSEAHRRGELIMAGAFADPVDGAALVFRTDDPAAPVRFAEDDPYVKNGLVTNWRVRAWNVVVGG